MSNDMGASQANGLAGAEAPEPPTRLCPTDGIPSAVFCVAVTMSRHTGATTSHTITQSWTAGVRSEAILRALEYARKAKPGYSIDDWLVAEIPLPLIVIDDGARSAPRYAAEVVRKHDPGRFGLIENLERLADHLDACNALAAGSGTAKTAQPVECEASQSGPKGNAHD